MATRPGPLAEDGGTTGLPSRFREPEQSNIDRALQLRHPGTRRHRGGVRRPRARRRDVPRACIPGQATECRGVRPPNDRSLDSDESVRPRHLARRMDHWSPDLLDRFAGLKDYTTGGGSILSQTIATWALGQWDFFLRRAKRILDANRRIVAEAINEMPALQGDVPRGGIVLFPHCTVDVAKLANRLLKQYGTVIAEGRFFGAPNHFRLGLGGETRNLREGLANLRQLLGSMS